MPDIITIIKQRMDARGITQRAVAAHLGVKPPLISDYMRGVKRPGLGNLEKWLEFLELDITTKEQRR